jgi:hypothetical protein
LFGLASLTLLVRANYHYYSPVVNRAIQLQYGGDSINFIQAQAAGEYLQNQTLPSDLVYNFGAETGVAYFAQRLPASKYYFYYPFHQIAVTSAADIEKSRFNFIPGLEKSAKELDREINIDQLMVDLRTNQPKYILISPPRPAELEIEYQNQILPFLHQYYQYESHPEFFYQFYRRK